MNDRITDLLDELADDGGRPLGFTVTEVTARGRVVRRRRRVLTAAAPLTLAAAGVALALVVADGPTGTGTGTTPYATDRPSPSSDPSRAPVTAQDTEVRNRCLAVEPAIADWSLDAQLTDAEGSTATFVSDDRARWRTCTLGAPGDEVGPAWPLDTAPVPDPWPVPDAGIAFSDLCPKEAPACSDRLFQGAYPLREGVADVEVETPRGARSSVDLGVATYVVRFREPGTGSSVPPVVATLRDAGGGLVTVYDYNELLR